MRLSPQITYRGLQKTAALETLILEKAAKLEQFYREISSCRIAVEKNHDHPESGSPYRIRLDITVPESREIVVDHSPDAGFQYEPLETAIRDAFEAASRQLKAMSEQQHIHMKTSVPGQREIDLEAHLAGTQSDIPPAS